MLVLAGAAHADRTTDLVTAITACEHDDGDQCLAAAEQMEHDGLASRFGYSPGGLRTRADDVYDRRCAADDSDACFARGVRLERLHGDDGARGHSLVEHACELHSGGACLQLGRSAKTRAIAIARFEQACS